MIVTSPLLFVLCLIVLLGMAMASCDKSLPEYSFGFYNATGAQIVDTRADWQTRGIACHDGAGILGVGGSGAVSHQQPRPFTYVHPLIRYVGLISPVIGPLEAPGLWPRSLPAGVVWMSQALDNQPNNPVLPQITITRAAGTRGLNVIYPDDHSDVGREPAALSEMIQESKLAGAPVH